MKVAVIIYHKNINSIYKKAWIEKSYKSILSQTYKDFSIYEINYGEDDFKLYREYPCSKEYHYYKITMNNHAQAMNFLIDECVKDGCDVIFNTNLDDINHKDRFDTQLKWIKKGYDIVSSNFIYIDENDKQSLKMTFDKVDIKKELMNDNNVICHPSVCFSRNFVLKNKYITSEIPREDLLLWKRTCNDYKFHICSEYLLNYRIHNNQITKNHENKKIKHKIGLLIISTNNYTEFLEPLIKSADKYFLPEQEVTYFIFTNSEIDIDTKNKIEVFKVRHKNWPWMTLGRYKIFYEHSNILSDMDFLFYCDVDMIFVSEVGDEILSDRVATQHPGYYGTKGTPETNSKSLAYIDKNEEFEYFAGGFNGGTAKEYIEMSRILSKNIDIDFSNDIISVWHDESHLNRYFIDNPPTKILSPSYCYAEDMIIPFDKKLIAINKSEHFIKTKAISQDIIGVKETEIQNTIGQFNTNTENTLEEKENIFYFPVTNVNYNRCSCGELKNRVSFNFCQKCNKLY